VCFTKPTKDTVGKDVGGVKVADGKPADVPPLQRDAPKASTSSATAAAAAAGSTDEVEEYKAKLAEKRRLAREKAEIEAAQQEEMRRQQQSVDIASSCHIGSTSSIPCTGSLQLCRGQSLKLLFEIKSLV